MKQATHKVSTHGSVDRSAAFNDVQRFSVSGSGESLEEAQMNLIGFLTSEP